ncbi:TPA: 3-deoxy-7-phosphoheptulonate synthase [Vibrio vulnificus]|nr:3-deoxy-7-phosphoheptulonate synthase [Vibrio vulnificus]HDY7424534.1 3-deoxy-7-phosphoheptulonate synthase [Vibrio vulnificus]HDY7496235.1 3-deoxy-7-phosphoheptulonate synthase [Vibrio vulnificus]HDY7603380.1 3-deoxy-7-phosphoheptulonate synthase [Vibrio vulnificus]
MKEQVNTVALDNNLELLSPRQVMEHCHKSSALAVQTIRRNRDAIKQIVSGDDSRLLVVVGPCSIHNVEEAIDYAQKIAQARQMYSETLEIVMRVYFEKPRTTVGWKGLINDPYLNGSFEINDGIKIARNLLVSLTEMGIPVACEFLDMITPGYLQDLVSWGAIGARTTESQIHRELASNLPFPIGFKNATNGNVNVAMDGVKAAQARHFQLTIDQHGQASVAHTLGNPHGHIILRGGLEPNYQEHHVASSLEELKQGGLTPKLMIDCSHGNSSKQYQRQRVVGQDICRQLENGGDGIMGVMIESNLVEGRQDLVEGKALAYGQSVTDACIDWESTLEMLSELSASVSQRNS